MSSSSYPGSPDELIASLSAIWGAAGILFVVLTLFLSVLLAIAIYILTVLPIYRLAKNVGHPHAWLAWIPYGNTYVIATIPHRTYKLFSSTFRTDNRMKAFWWFFGISIGISFVSGFFGVLSMIPYLGIIISLFSYAVSLGQAIVVRLMLWRFNYDLISTYDTHENAMLYSILGAFIPLVFVVYTWVIRNREPEYGFTGYFDSSKWVFED